MLFYKNTMKLETHLHTLCFLHFSDSPYCMMLVTTYNPYCMILVTSYSPCCMMLVTTYSPYCMLVTTYSIIWAQLPIPVMINIDQWWPKHKTHVICVLHMYINVNIYVLGQLHITIFGLSTPDGSNLLLCVHSSQQKKHFCCLQFSYSTRITLSGTSSTHFIHPGLFIITKDNPFVLQNFPQQETLKPYLPPLSLFLQNTISFNSSLSCL
jgi:hypothetical protein